MNIVYPDIYENIGRRDKSGNVCVNVISGKDHHGVSHICILGQYEGRQYLAYELPAEIILFGNEE
jgi:hypothetical protein